MPWRRREEEEGGRRWRRGERVGFVHGG